MEMLTRSSSSGHRQTASRRRPAPGSTARVELVQSDDGRSEQAIVVDCTRDSNIRRTSRIAIYGYVERVVTGVTSRRSRRIIRELPPPSSSMSRAARRRAGSDPAAIEHDDAVVVAVEHRPRLERDPAELDRDVDLPRAGLATRSRVRAERLDADGREREALRRRARSRSRSHPAQPFAAARPATMSPSSATRSEPPPSTTSTRPSPGSPTCRFRTTLSSWQRTVEIGPLNAATPPNWRNTISQTRASTGCSSRMSAVDVITTSIRRSQRNGNGRPASAGITCAVTQTGVAPYRTE